MTYTLLFFAFLWAGIQNALAGGGTFITLPLLVFTGMDARAANVTSTIALFPAQAATAWSGSKLASGAAGLSFRALTALSLLGGALGAGLLLVTPSSFFARLLPWLLLFATAVFAWGNFGQRPTGTKHPLGRNGAAVCQFAISIYGGFFGGGIGFLMYAALAAAGVSVRVAAAIKNVLAAVMNASAVAIFLFSPQVHWWAAAVSSAGAIVGAMIGSHLLARVNERLLRAAVIIIGLALTIGL